MERALLWSLTLKNPCSFPCLHLHHSRGPASATAWGRRSQDPLRFPRNGSTHTQTRKGPLKEGRKQPLGPVVVPGPSPLPDFCRLPLGGPQLSGKGNRDNAGRRSRETTRPPLDGAFFSQSTTRLSCTFAAWSGFKFFFLIPKIALNTLFTSELETEESLPPASFLPNSPSKPMFSQQETCSLFAPQAWHASVLGPSKGHRPQQARQQWVLLSPDSSAVVFNPSNQTSKPAQMRDSGVWEPFPVFPLRGASCWGRQWTKTPLSVLRALWSSCWSVALVGHSLMSWGFLTRPRGEDYCEAC